MDKKHQKDSLFLHPTAFATEQASMDGEDAPLPKTKRERSVCLDRDLNPETKRQKNSAIEKTPLTFTTGCSFYLHY